MKIKPNEIHLVVTFDNRGIGQSSVPSNVFIYFHFMSFKIYFELISNYILGDPYTLEGMAADCMCIAQHLGWKEFNLFGVSMGGAISQALVLEYPSAVKKLILGCTSACLSSIDGENLLALVPQGKVTKETIREIMSSSLKINLTDSWIESNQQKFNELIDFELSLKKPKLGIRKF